MFVQKKEEESAKFESHLNFQVDRIARSQFVKSRSGNIASLTRDVGSVRWVLSPMPPSRSHSDPYVPQAEGGDSNALLISHRMFEP
jgi:hypothetical protein